MKCLIAILFGLSLSTVVWADSPEAARKRAELSMLVTGTIDVAADGSVRSYTLDKEDKIPPAIVDLIRRSALGWHFELDSSSDAVAGVRINASLRIVAQRQSDATYAISLAGASFDSSSLSEAITPRKFAPPSYPLKALQGRISGTVYVVLRVAQDGHVTDVAVEQVNLKMLGTDSELKDRRTILARSALIAAKQWTFNVPEVGAQTTDGQWHVRVPVHFHIRRPDEPQSPSYGQWLAYVPGPKTAIPWLDSISDEADSSRDALADDQIHQVHGGLKLVTPLGPI